MALVVVIPKEGWAMRFFFEKSVPTYRWYSYHVVSFTELREIILEMSCTHIGLYNTPEKYEYTGKNYL